MKDHLALFIVHCAFLVLTVLFYSIEMIAIGKKANQPLLRSAFNFLFCTGAILSFLYEGCFTITVAVPFVPNFSFPQIEGKREWFKIVHGLAFLSSSCQDYLCAALAANRLTAAAAGNRHEKWWKFIGVFAFFIILAGPSIALWPLFLSDLEVVLLSVGEGRVAYVTSYSALHNGHDLSLRLWSSVAVGGGLSAIFIIITTIWMVVRDQSPYATSNAASHERMLCLYTIVASIINSSVAAAQVYMATEVDVSVLSWHYAAPWLVHLKCLSPALLILAFSKPLRLKVKTLLKFPSSIVSPPSVPLSNFSSVVPFHAQRTTSRGMYF